MSQTVASVIVNLLVTILPLIGIQIGTPDLTKTIQVLVAIGTGLWIWYRRVTLNSDVNWLGVKQ